MWPFTKISAPVVVKTPRQLIKAAIRAGQGVTPEESVMLRQQVNDLMKYIVDYIIYTIRLDCRTPEIKWMSSSLNLPYGRFFSMIEIMLKLELSEQGVVLESMTQNGDEVYFHVSWEDLLREEI